MTSDRAGMWRRTLLVDADGSRDTGTDVTWLQGPTAYVDSRGFAGRLGVRGDVFEWHRDVDLQEPGPFPDAGRMHWDGETLVETGIHEQYVEHWVREPGPTTPCGATFVRGPGGASGLLVRVGARFGWGGGGVVVIGNVGGSRWRALGIGCSGGQIQTNGVRWTVEHTEGELNL
ncbi:hypothetical protein M1247_19340 [Mycobacterium sp. 21AC1]|uniref:hypothetical protein n=1 Tax=[Mycobacterium] appelbergii TaxID=2939269 RepID=UPI002939364B|nr:hypothetical protein [Mycobacterium sp. 21AC1]MDV3127087.1 hypothetical protein [Mycobacterium sp. 21AC1]